MRSITRIFANAVARRIAVLLVAAVLAWLGVDSARAANCMAAGDGCDQGQAYAAAWAYANSVSAGVSRAKACVVSYLPGSPPYRGGRIAESSPCASGTAWQVSASFFFGKGKECESRPDWNGPYPYLTGGAPANGSVTCNSGCKQAWYGTGDGYFNGKYTSTPGTCSTYDDEKCKADFGSGYFWNDGMSSCQPEDGKCEDGSKPNSLGQCKPEPCPAGKVQNADGTCENKKNECPAGNVKAPSGECLPGEGQCASGEVKGKDGTCKRDSDGDGKPDEGEDEGTADETFAGGDSCTSPPSCSGSVILCGQARIQWRIDCNTRKNRNIAGGSCASVPVCTGEKCDAVEYSSLLMQWRTACALEKLASKSGEGGEGETGIKDHLTAMKQAEVNALRALGQDDGHGNVDPSEIWADRDYGTGDLDSGMFGGGGGSCDLSFTIGGEVVSMPPQFWRIVSIIHWLMIAGAYLWVASKLG